MPIITNTASANYTINGVNLNLSDSAQFTRDTVVTPTDDIKLRKKASTSSATIGNKITYILTIENPNPRVLSNVIIQDTLPTGLNYINNTAKLNATDIDSNQIITFSNMLSINIGDIPAFTTWNISYQVNISSVTTIGNNINKAIAIADTVTSSQAQANVVINEPVVVIPLNPLVIEKTSDKTDVSLNDVVSFSIIINNNNSEVVTGAVVNDVLPNGLEYISGSAKFNGSEITANVANQLGFNIGDLSANSSAELTYDVLVRSVENNSRSLTNTASVIADDTDANSNLDSATINVINDALLLNKTTTSSKVENGDIIDYTIAVTNPLTRDLTNLVIRDNLPLGFNYQANSSTVNNALLSDNVVTNNGSNLEFNLGSLSASTS